MARLRTAPAQKSATPPVAALKALSASAKAISSNEAGGQLAGMAFLSTETGQPNGAASACWLLHIG